MGGVPANGGVVADRCLSLSRSGQGITNHLLHGGTIQIYLQRLPGQEGLMCHKAKF